MRRVARPYAKWRHAGEEGAIAVYTARCWGVSVLLLYAALSLCLFLAHLPYLLITGPLMFATIPDLENARRAIIFTPAALRYRPTFGKLRGIAISHIFVLRRSRVTKDSYRAPLSLPAIELTLLFGEKLTLALDREGADEIVDRLRKMTGLQLL